MPDRCQGSLMSPDQLLDSLGLLPEKYVDHLFEVLTIRLKSTFSIDWYLLVYSRLPQDILPRPPLRLEDRHISSHLALRHVIPSPSLLSDLQNNFLSRFRDFISTNGAPMLSHNYPEPAGRPTSVSCASRVMSVYFNHIGHVASKYAAKLHLNPEDDSWPSPIEYIPRSPCTEYFLFEAALPIKAPQARTALGMKPDPESAIGLNVGVDREELGSRWNTPCVFSLYPPTEEGVEVVQKSLVHQFGSTLATVDAYDPPGARHKEQRTSDWENAFWAAYVPNVDSSSAASNHSGSAPQGTRIWIPEGSGQRLSEFDPDYRPHAPHFIQRAWNTAVENDATFLVLSNGNIQRIGIRHRATNTLFLSDVLELQHESYCLIQLALFSAMMQDSLNRDPTPIPLSRENETPDLGQTPSPTRKKQKATHTQGLPESFDEEMARRPVVLLTFNLGVFRSHKASAFLRTEPSCVSGTPKPSIDKPQGGKFYPVWDCINIEVNEIVGSGLNCRVYRGTARMRSNSDTIIEGPVVLKAPYAAYLDREMRIEYSAYSALHHVGVTEGISKVHGVFEDPESGIGMLLMEDLGKLTLDKRICGKWESVPLISETEFKTLRSIVQSINGAGILHGDIKPDNIMFDGDGKPYIIDFGVSQFKTNYPTNLDNIDERPPWSEIDERALSIVKADTTGVRSSDLRTIEDMFIGRFRKDRRY
ncbi:hypothetical protein BJ165DRAFT_1458353 [Panaeolus papilionaceus]|nr:hypothetical protein BJ165DRAFT_1458353 [Panaeolus papilionaceus]